jgi:hypothetical protein
MANPTSSYFERLKQIKSEMQNGQAPPDHPAWQCSETKYCESTEEYDRLCLEGAKWDYEHNFKPELEKDEKEIHEFNKQVDNIKTVEVEEEGIEL